MYKKRLKHLDFIILDVVCLWISFMLTFGMRHGLLNVFANSLYCDAMWSLTLTGIVVILLLHFLNNVFKRGFCKGFTATVKQISPIILCSVVHLFTFKSVFKNAEGYPVLRYLLC